MYLLSIVSILAFAAILRPSGGNARRKALYCSLMAVQFILMTGLRSMSVGADTYSYEYNFEIVKWMNWPELFSRFYEQYWGSVSAKDPGFYIFTKAAQLISTDYRVYMFLIGCLFTIPMGIWIYRHSSRPEISFLTYQILFWAFFGITGYRQTLATALVVLAGYDFIREKKLFRFLLLCIIAFTLHKSSISYFPFYFASNLKISKRNTLIFLALILIAGTVGSQLYKPIAEWIGYDADEFVRPPWTYFILIAALTAISVWRAPRIVKLHADKGKHMVNAMYLGCLTTTMAIGNQNFMRIQQYYTINLMLLLPMIIDSFPKKQHRKIVYFGAVCLMVAMFLFQGNRYLFFWE